MLSGARHCVRCVLADGHTNVVLLEKDGQVVRQADASSPGAQLAYRGALKRMSMAEVLPLAERIDAEDRAYLRRGIEMNLAISEWGFEVGGTARQLFQMHRDGFLADDVFYRAKLRVASAVDARMAGMAQAAMTSGGSGNQGIVATLTPYIVGREMGVDAERILESIAVAHLVNAYAKCFVGELSVICGCAMAAGIASAAAIVYQHAGLDLPRITLAAGNVIGDLGGLICDGAKPGCAMKAVTAVDTAVRSALMALQRLRAVRRRRPGRPDHRGLLPQRRPHHLGRHVPGRSDVAPYSARQDRRQRQGMTPQPTYVSRNRASRWKSLFGSM